MVGALLPDSLNHNNDLILISISYISVTLFITADVKILTPKKLEPLLLLCLTSEKAMVKQ